MRLWWLSSGSSSIRMPVWRSVSIAAQVQNARSSSPVRSRRLPVSGSSAQILAAACRWRGAAQGRAVGGERLAGRGGLRGGRAAAAVAMRRSLAAGHQHGQHGQPFPGALVHAGLAGADLLLPGQVLGPDRAGRGPRAPAGGVLHRPLGDVEVEGADRGQLVQRASPPLDDLLGPPIGPGDLAGLAQPWSFMRAANRSCDRGCALWLVWFLKMDMVMRRRAGSAGSSRRSSCRDRRSTSGNG